MGRFLATALLCALLAGGAPLRQARPESAGSSVEVTYIANEGFLLSGGGKIVLVDALFRRGVPGYAVPSEVMRKQMEAAQSPFDRVDLALATHSHDDHFDAEAVGAHLMSNRSALFASVAEATGMLRDGFKDFAYISSRVHTVSPGKGGRARLELNGISIEVLRAPHGRAQHAAYLFTLAGKKFLHLGDTDGAAADFAPLRLERENIDVAFIPDWFLLYPDWPEVVRKHIRPRRIVAMHVALENPPEATLRQHMRKVGGHAGLARKIPAEFPGAIVALVPGARFRF